MKPINTIKEMQQHISECIATSPELNHNMDNAYMRPCVPALPDGDELLAQMLWDINRLPARSVDVFRIRREYYENQHAKVLMSQYKNEASESAICDNKICDNNCIQITTHINTPFRSSDLHFFEMF